MKCLSASVLVTGRASLFVMLSIKTFFPDQVTRYPARNSLKAAMIAHKQKGYDQFMRISNNNTEYSRCENFDLMGMFNKQSFCDSNIPNSRGVTTSESFCSLAAARKRRHQWCVSLTPNNTKTIGRMTCHCFLQPIRRELTSSCSTSLLVPLLMQWLIREKSTDIHHGRS